MQTICIAIVQARMGSARLPGKMLRLLAGRPLVDYALERLLRARKPGGPLDAVVLATSTAENNDALVLHVQSRWPEVLVVRGAEEDVLSRFVDAIRQTRATAVIRATGDCPLINLEALVEMLAALTAGTADVVNYRPGYEYVDKGLEAVRAAALLRAADDPETQPQDREHVTSLLYRRPGRYRVQYIESEPFLRRGDVRLTVDTEADLAFLEALAAGMARDLGALGLREVVDYLDHHPELLRLNAAAGRKSTLHERARLGFRCDGGAALGLGHVVGCLRLAKIAAGELGVGIEFVLREDVASLGLIKNTGFAVEVLPAGLAPEADIDRLIAKARESDWSGLVVNFCKDDLDRYAPHMERLKQAGLRLIFMDNPVPPSWRLGDLLINALPHPDYPGYDPDSHPACFDGLAYFLPDPAVSSAAQQARAIRPEVARVLVAMGGGDSEDTTGLALEGLARAGFRGFTDVVLGSANPRLEAVRALFQRLGLRGEVSQRVGDLADRMAAADLGFSALGLTTYEMASCGLPVILIAGHAFNAGVAAGFALRYGGAQFLGVRDALDADQVARAYAVLAADAAERSRMARAQQAAVDGRGAERVRALLERFFAPGAASMQRRAERMAF